MEVTYFYRTQVWKVLIWGQKITVELRARLWRWYSLKAFGWWRYRGFFEFKAILKTACGILWEFWTQQVYAMFGVRKNQLVFRMSDPSVAWACGSENTSHQFVTKRDNNKCVSKCLHAMPCCMQCGIVSEWRVVMAWRRLVSMSNEVYLYVTDTPPAVVFRKTHGCFASESQVFRYTSHLKPWASKDEKRYR